MILDQRRDPSCEHPARSLTSGLEPTFENLRATESDIVGKTRGNNSLYVFRDPENSAVSQMLDYIVMTDR